MKADARIQKRWILLVTFSIIWIFIGSLVIFHQEQVLGKTFKWHQTSFLVPKSKEKSIGIFQEHGGSLSSDIYSLAGLEKDSLRKHRLASSSQVLEIHWKDEAATAQHLTFLPPRAPPAA